MKKEIISDALGGIDEKYIEEAEDYKAKSHKKAFISIAASAACIAVALLIAVPALSSRSKNAFELSDASSGVKVEYGEPKNIPQTSYSLAYFYTEEELFTVFDTAVFRGEITDIQNIVIDSNGVKAYRAIAKIKISKAFRGDCEAGDIVTVLLPCPIDNGIDVSDCDVVSAMRVGLEGIFMPMIYDENSLREENGAVLCLKDIADYGFADGIRYAFIEADGGLIFDRTSYESISNAETLDEIEEYVISMIEKTD